MPGERLMCVWEAAFTQTPDTSDKQLTKKALNGVVTLLEDLPCIRYLESKFDNHFKSDSDVNIASFKRYLFEILAETASPQCMIQEEVEDKCWEICKSFYTSKHLTEQAMRKLWKICNRLADLNSFPPQINSGVADWFVDKISTHLGRNWKKKSTRHTKSYTFSSLLDRLTTDFFSEKTLDSVSSCVNELHSWLVLEVTKTGWLFKRTRKQANWTNWVKRWFVLSSTKLSYYDNPNEGGKKNLRGELFLTGSKVENMLPCRSFIRKMNGRFKVTNLPYMEMELATEELSQRRSWVISIQEVIDASKNKTTPIQSLLKERWGEAVNEVSSKLEETQLKNADAISVTHPKTAVKVRKHPDQDTKAHQSSLGLSSTSCQEESFDNAENTSLIKESTEKIKGVFMTIDKDGNGKIDASEFRNFISELGLKINNGVINMMYMGIKKENADYITFQEFSDYFENVLLDETFDGATEAKLRAAFLEADRDATGTLNFKEYAEYLWEKKRSMHIGKLITAFNDMDVAQGGEVSFEQFRTFYQTRLSYIPETTDQFLNEVDEVSNAIDSKLKDLYNKTEANDLARFIRDRWSKFATFKRYGATGQIAMRGKEGMVDDIVPGEYSLLELACFSDLPPIVPKYTSINRVKWESSPSKGRSGKLIFPEDFDGVLVTDTATPEHLRYYGCSFAEGNQIKISLLYRHGIQDFTYENQYLEDYVTASNGGAGLEKHEFSHLDCPLEGDSGTFILGKLVGEDELHLTAFSVPVRHTLYIPGGVIHSNDYLKGTWRTMLSDEADIDHVHLVRGTHPKQLEHFKFEFRG